MNDLFKEHLKYKIPIRMQATDFIESASLFHMLMSDVT